ncbi:MAG: hypothetical protein KC492_03530, partial [Myxococcales bacterium]|nr:hypothetical protein [Myxococcales bacterium]
DMKLVDVVDVVNGMSHRVGCDEFYLDEVSEWVSETVEQFREELRPGEASVDVLVSDAVNGLCSFLFILVPHEPGVPSLRCGVAMRARLVEFFDNVNLGDVEGCLAFLSAASTELEGAFELSG